MAKRLLAVIRLSAHSVLVSPVATPIVIIILIHRFNVKDYICSGGFERVGSSDPTLLTNYSLLNLSYNLIGLLLGLVNNSFDKIHDDI